MKFKFLTSLISATGQGIDPSYTRDVFMNSWASLGALFGVLWNFICEGFYMIVKWLLAFTDFLQYFIQKLIGLDYWLNNNVYSIEGATKSDLLFSFLYNDTVQKVFNTMLAVFAVLLIIFTVYAIIRSEWQYVTGKNFGDGTNSKAQIITNSIKAIAMVLVFPLALTLGIISSNAILASIVKALNIDMASTFGGTLFLIGSKNANKYRIYAKSGQRAAISDQISFYVKDGVVIRFGPTDCNDGYVHQISDYGRFLAELRSGNGATLYKVNTMFDSIDIDDGNFSGYCVGMDIGDSRQYYMVRCGSSNEEKKGMYYYLKNILRVDIMGDDEVGDAGNRTIYNEIGRGSFGNSVGMKGFINNKYFGSSSCEQLWYAFWNTWGYSSIYDSRYDFETSLNYSVLSSANNDNAILGQNISLLSYMGLGNSFSTVKMLYNSNLISSYFDGGQFNLVQLQNEYNVMADVVDFMNNNGVTLYMLDMTSDMIDWKYGDYTVDSKWISLENDSNKLHILPSGPVSNAEDSADHPLTNTPLANSTAFVVAYSDMANDIESGNILYTAKAGVSNELKGSKFIMCYKVVDKNGTSTRYVPLVNRKEFKDPVTGNTYTFSSDYYASNYRGVVLAKGVFANKNLFGKSGNVDGLNGSPTYITTGSEMQDGTSIDATKPYYYHMDVSGTVSQYAGYADTKKEYVSTYLASLGGLVLDSTEDADLADLVIRNNGSNEIFPDKGFNFSNLEENDPNLNSTNSFAIQRRLESGAYENVELTKDLLKNLKIEINYFTNGDANNTAKATAEFSGVVSGQSLEFEFLVNGSKNYFYIGYSGSEFYIMTFDKSSQTYIKYDNVDENTGILTNFATLDSSIINGEVPGDERLGVDGNSLEIREGISVDTAVYPSYSVVNDTAEDGKILVNRFKISGADVLTSEVIQTLVIPLEYKITGIGSVFCSATYAGQSVTINDGTENITYSLFSFVYGGANYYLTVKNTTQTFSICSYSSEDGNFVANETTKSVVAKTRRYKLMYDYVSQLNNSVFNQTIATLTPADFKFEDNVSGNSNLHLFSTSEKQIVMGGKYQYVNIYFDTKGTGRLVTVNSENNIVFAEPVLKSDENTNYIYHSDEYTFSLYNYYTAETGDPKVVETFAENITKDNQYESGFQIDKIKINSNCWYLNFLWSNWDLFPNDGIYKAQSSLLNSFSPAYNQLNKKAFDEKVDGFSITLNLTKDNAQYTVTATNTGMMDSHGQNRIYCFNLDGKDYYLTMQIHEDASVSVLDANGNKIQNKSQNATFMIAPTYKLKVEDKEINFNASDFGKPFIQNNEIMVETLESVSAGSLGTRTLFMKLKGGSLISYQESTNGNPTIIATEIAEKSTKLVGLGLKEFDPTKPTVNGLKETKPSNEDGWQFTIWVSPEFSWNAQSNSYGLYNGRNYVATIYKNLGTEVSSASEIASKSIRILYDGNTYYNISTQNKYDGDAAMVAYYNKIKGSFITSFHRTSSVVETFRSPSFAILPLLKFRIHFGFGTYSMSRDYEIGNSFKLSDGIQFDYFFENDDVKLSTFYVQSKISYWILVIASVLIIKTLMTALWGIIKRFYEITLYFLAMPAVASTIPLDEGNKFKSGIQEPLIKKVLSTYGVILGINVFFILLAPVRSLSQVFTEQDIAESGTYFLKYLPITAGMLNDYVYILFVLVAFTMIETLPGVISGLVGGDDVHAKGKETRKQVGESVSSAANFVSGKDAVEGVKKLGSTASNFIPGKNLLTAPARWVGTKVDRGLEAIGRGFGEGYRNKQESPTSSDGSKSDKGDAGSGGGGSGAARANNDLEAENSETTSAESSGASGGGSEAGEFAKDVAEFSGENVPTSSVPAKRSLGNSYANRIKNGGLDLAYRFKKAVLSALDIVGLKGAFSRVREDGTKRNLASHILGMPLRMVGGVLKNVVNPGETIKKIGTLAKNTAGIAAGLDFMHIAAGYSKETLENLALQGENVPESFLVMGGKAAGRKVSAGVHAIGKGIDGQVKRYRKWSDNRKAAKAIAHDIKHSVSYREENRHNAAVSDEEYAATIYNMRHKGEGFDKLSAKKKQKLINKAIAERTLSDNSLLSGASKRDTNRILANTARNIMASGSNGPLAQALRKLNVTDTSGLASAIRSNKSLLSAISSIASKNGKFALSPKQMKDEKLLRHLQRQMKGDVKAMVDKMFRDQFKNNSSLKTATRNQLLYFLRYNSEARNIICSSLANSNYKPKVPKSEIEKVVDKKISKMKIKEQKANMFKGAMNGAGKISERDMQAIIDKTCKEVLKKLEGQKQGG